jgi:tetratricopeptide (TPR) repeat protein
MPAVDAGVYGMLTALHRCDGEAADADRYEALYVARGTELGRDASEQQDLLGGYLSSVGLHELAIRALRQAVALDPRAAARQVHLAEAYRKAGRPAEAEAACARALELDPNAATAHLVLGEVYESQDKPLEALRHYESYVASGPRGPSLRAAEARVAILRGTHTPFPSRR